MKKPKSESYRVADEIYQNKKTQTFEDFCSLPINSQILMLFFYSSKFDRMLHELYLSLKIIIHLTIVIYLSPRLQKQIDDDKIIVSGNLMITFYKKYKLLADTLSCNLSPQLTEFLFDETLPLISLQIEDNLFELLKYSRSSVSTMVPLLTNLQENLQAMTVYEFEEEEIQDITKALKRFLDLFNKIKTQEQLVQHLEENPMKYSRKQIANFVLAANQQAKDKDGGPFSLSVVLKQCAELFKG